METKEKNERTKNRNIKYNYRINLFKYLYIIGLKVIAKMYIIRMGFFFEVCNIMTEEK